MKVGVLCEKYVDRWHRLACLIALILLVINFIEIDSAMDWSYSFELNILIRGVSLHYFLLVLCEDMAKLYFQDDQPLFSIYFLVLKRQYLRFF